jgi:hypothetical protein
LLQRTPYEKEIIHRSLVNAEKTSLRDGTMHSGPSLSPPSSQRWRSKLPPSSPEAGMKPLAVDKTMNTVADLERGLT